MPTIRNVITSYSIHYTKLYEKAHPVSSSNGEQKTVMNQPDIDKVVFSLVSEKTGFPEDRLSVDYRLLDDLNLDSIKAGSLLAELIKKYDLQGQIEASAHANSSLKEIISTIESYNFV